MNLGIWNREQNRDLLYRKMVLWTSVTVDSTPEYIRWFFTPYSVLRMFFAPYHHPHWKKAVAAAAHRMQVHTSTLYVVQVLGVPRSYSEYILLGPGCGID
jgi:hypothetical protein